MKTHILIASTFALMGIESAYSNCTEADYFGTQCTAITEPAQNIAHCKSYEFSHSLCYKNASGTHKKFHLCKECEDGYILTLNPDYTAMGCDKGDGGVYVCLPCSLAKTCDPHSEIEYDPDAWRDSWTGYQSNSYTECNTATCQWEKRTTYRCSAGYYGPGDGITENYVEGFGIMGLNGCTICPPNPFATQSGQSDVDDNATIQKCYLVEDIGYDFTGTYNIVPSGSRCYHD
ncbi:MAG: hypothetical protein K2I81_00140 [Alphaproteobacteria bacterium]|nr:hypothetical protein [Alphaproteobacteria bacterium]